MKKVISALTVAAMCASMSASVLPAFAIDAANAEFYLKAVDAGKGTISADGATVTFASAADAKGAKIMIQEFIKADTSEPYVEQILSGFRVVDSKSIKLGDGVDYNATGHNAEATYEVNGKNVKTDKFFSCFATASKTGKFDAGVKQFMWGHSDEWAFDYDGPDTLNLIWAQPNGAKFVNEQTDKYPFTEFSATLGDDIADGTYVIEILDTWENKINGTPDNPNGVQDGSSINAGDVVTKVTKTKNLTIVVGKGGTTPTEKPTDKPTEKPTDKPTEKPTEKPTDKPTEKPTEATEKPTEQQGPSLADKQAAKEWTWYFDDVVYDPAADPDGIGAKITAYVTKDEGTYGYEFTPLINGKSIADAGFTVIEASQVDGGYNFGSFDYNEENGHLGGAASAKADSKVADGTPVVELYLLPPKDAKAGTKYTVSFDGLLIGNFAEEKKYPKSIDGSITIKGDAPDKPTEATEKPTDKPTEKPTEATDKPTEKPTEKPTDAPKDKKNASEWTWYFDDVAYDPAADTDGIGAKITAYVTKDEGTYGYEFTPLINGKSIKDAGFTVIEASQVDGGYNFGSFDYNEENGHLGGAASAKADSKVADGTPVVELYLLPPKDAKEGTVYTVSFDGLLIGNFAEEKKYPKSIDGSITIGKEIKPTEATEATDKPTEKPTQATDKPTEKPSGDYLYGDVNEDGKVELVDVVKLNRIICNIDKDASAKAIVQGNCYRANKEADDKCTRADLDSKDSVEILKYLIGLVTTLPTKA